MEPLKDLMGMEIRVPNCCGDMRENYSERCDGMCPAAAVCVMQDIQVQRILGMVEATE